MVSARTYKRGDRYFGLVEFFDKLDAANCVAELDSRCVDGSQLRLRCVHGSLHSVHESRGEQKHGREKRLSNGSDLDKNGETHIAGWSDSTSCQQGRVRTRLRNQSDARDSEHEL